MEKKNEKSQSKLLRRILISVLCVSVLFIAVPTGFGKETGLVKTAQAASTTSKTSIAVATTSQLRVTGTTGKVKWSSSNSTVCSVNQSGKIKGKKPGTATIKAKVNGKTLKCKVTVKQNIIKFSSSSPRDTGYYDFAQNGGYLKSIYMMPVYMEYLGDGSLKIQFKLTNYRSNWSWSYIDKLYNIQIWTKGGSKLVGIKAANLISPFSVPAGQTTYYTLHFSSSQVKKVVNLRKAKGIKYTTDISRWNLWSN